MAIMTLWSKTVSGNRGRWARYFIETAPVLQTLIQIPHPSQACSFCTAYIFSFAPSTFFSLLIASTGQPLHIFRNPCM
jgi:hypothetical protein